VATLFLGLLILSITLLALVVALESRDANRTRSMPAGRVPNASPL
jgi:hypothetical protein